MCLSFIAILLLLQIVNMLYGSNNMTCTVLFSCLDKLRVILFSLFPLYIVTWVKSRTGDVNVETEIWWLCLLLLPNLSYCYIVDLSTPIVNRWAFSSLKLNGFSLSRALFFNKKNPSTTCRLLLTRITD